MKKKIYYGNVAVGGDSIVTVQSMTNTDTRNVIETVKQIKSLERKGCDIIRCAVPDMESAYAIKEIKKEIYIPLIADIHFDHKLAIKSLENGADGIRLNPGNIGSKENIREVVKVCSEKNIPIRVGVNSGSVKKEYVEKYNGINANSLVESAVEQVGIIEDCGYDNIVISIKSSDVNLTYEANSLMRKRNEYPLHLGITEAGSFVNGTIKSAMGIGSLLMKGIGDTIRISLTDSPEKEVLVGRKILQFLNIRPYGPNIISCPTCGRTRINLEKIVNEVEEALVDCKKDLNIAIMGCIVNGPGEAKEADIGIAGGDGKAVLFKKGEVVRTLKEKDVVNALLEEIEKI
jgi:(E)-4-hydroxy-3-methylbut-2-enyl-diphosphate synthase